MKRITQLPRRLLAMLAVLVMLAGSSLTMRAAETERTERSYEIAVVFDNSGSMYMEQNKAWSRAKYAMEIFASMLNYDEGDRLTVFPMWEVTTDGSTPKGSRQESTKPVEIRSKEDIDDLSRMYTVYAAGTPFTPVERAYTYLKSSTATDKWLIVLTDGDFDGELSQASALRKALLPKADGSVKVQYLRFSGSSSVQSDEAKGFYADSCDDSSLMTKLIEICNAIFQRAVLPANSLSGQTLTLDLSMKNLIVFVQGEGAKVNALKNGSGDAVAVTMDSGQRKFSETKYGTGNYTCVADTSLYGQVVTFAGCEKGTYTLDYSGSDQIQVFYEPDVDIRVTLVDKDGQEVDFSSGELTAGEYTITSSIVDGATGEDVTHHPLLGDDVKLITKVKTSDADTYTAYENGSKITFLPDEDTEVVVEGTYLRDYKISTKDSPDLFPFSFEFREPEIALKVKADVLQSQSWYRLRDHGEWKPIRVALTIEGQPLTAEQMAATAVTFQMDEGVTYWYEAAPDESAYYVHIGYDEAGTYTEPKEGSYRLKAEAVYTDQYGKPTTASDSVGFEVRWYSAVWRWLLYIVLLVVLLLVVVFILTRKAWPKAMYLNVRGGLNDIEVGEDTNLASTLYNGVLTCTAKKASMLYQRFGSGAAIKVTEVEPGFDVTSFKIGNSAVYSRTPAGFKDARGNSFQETFVRNRTRIIITRNNRPPIDGRISMNGK